MAPIQPVVNVLDLTNMSTLCSKAPNLQAPRHMFHILLLHQVPTTPILQNAFLCILWTRAILWTSGTLYTWKVGEDLCFERSLKKIKRGLEIWQQQHSQNLEERISEVKDRISTLDALGEDVYLEVEKLKELYSLTFNLFTLLKLNTSKQWQPSRFI